MFIGKKASGKSTIQRDIMFHTRDKCHFGMAMSPTVGSVDFFRQCMPASWVFPSMFSEKIEQVVDKQKKLLHEKRRALNLFFILDDTIYDKKVMNSKAMREIMQQARHLKCHMSCTLQSISTLSHDLRPNIDYVFCTSETNLATRKQLHRAFFGIIDKFEDFNKVFEATTQKYACIVLDNTSMSKNVNDCIFWYRAKHDIPTFVMGDKVFHNLSLKRELAMSEQVEEEEHQKPRIEVRQKPAKFRVAILDDVNDMDIALEGEVRPPPISVPT